MSRISKHLNIPIIPYLLKRVPRKTDFLIIFFIVLLIFILNKSLYSQQNLSFDPDAANTYQQGIMALRMRKLTLATQIFRNLIDKHPDSIHTSIARRQLASILKDTKQYDKALELLEQILETDNSEDSKRYAQKEMLGILYEIHQFKRGIDLIEKWRKENPEDNFLNRQLAKFYLQSGRKDEAWLLLESIMEKNNSYEAFKDLLDLAMKSGEVEKLLQTLENRRLRYSSASFADYISDCYIALSRNDEAIEAIKNVENLDQELNLLKKLSRLQLSAETIDELYETLDKILVILPYDWSTIRLMGICKFRQNLKDEAMRIWKKPLKAPHVSIKGFKRDFYMNFTTVLIEHQLYQEAIDAFREARTAMQQRTLFSEEVASVLDAMGKKEEALKEYLKVLAEGFFNNDVFERLYKAHQEGYDLEKGLHEMQTQFGQNSAIMRAMIELYLRNTNMADIEKICRLIGNASGNLDQIIYEKLNQETFLSPNKFCFELTKELTQKYANSGLALRIAILLLEMGSNNEKWQREAFSEAVKVAKNPRVADARLKAQLMLKLAEFAFYTNHDSITAEKQLDDLLQSNLLSAAKDIGVAASILKAHIMTCNENYDSALKTLDKNKKIVEDASNNIFSYDIISESDFMAAIHLEKAKIMAHNEDYQGALNELKIITEDFTESEWMNESLELALFITRRSMGSFDLLKRSFKARRLTEIGKNSLAIEELQAAIKENASATELVTEMQADIILLKSLSKNYESNIKNSTDKQYENLDKIIDEIDNFVKTHPESFKTADLLERKWQLLKVKNAQKTEINELIQLFIETFPSDLRSEKFKKLL